MFAVEGLREVRHSSVPAQTRLMMLRQSGYTGPIKIISKEPYIPIDRTKLSKALIDDAKKLAVRDEQWYKDNRVDMELGKVVTDVDIEKQTVSVQGGGNVGYDHLILATGASPMVGSLAVTLAIR